jgi:ferredoxin--NADP+ reductase
VVHVAVIGAGPSGVFAAAELLKRPDVSVDVFDKLPTPFGLVRYGVAPDHHKIKSVTRVLSKVLADPQVRFSGNTEYRRDITADDLRAAYDVVLVATGAPLARKLGVPGEELPGNYAAADLVSWYNGHPQARAAFDTPPPRPSPSSGRAT